TISFKNSNYIHDYYALEGTSMATPHVSGVAALMKAKDHNISPAAIRNIMIETVTKGVEMEGKTVSDGILDASAALKMVSNNGYMGPQIEVDPEFLDFGIVNIGESKELKIKVKNVGNETLQLQEVSIEDKVNYTMRTSLTMSIPPYGEESWRIIFNPLGVGPNRTDLVIKSSDPENPELRIRIRGVGVSPDVPF
ncbi:S8 family serine peptidase, partial [bacterium]|nr:S8 family serine peptidase [bacterium]